MLRLEGLRRTHEGASAPAVRDVDLEVTAGEVMVVVGPSGCGKSSILRMIAGLDDPDGGKVLLDGVDLARVPPERRDVAMVFQGYALYPHLTARGNMEFPLKMRKASKEARRERVESAAKLLEIGHLLDRRPDQLSGGERQRVAMGRALVRKPKVFLFDEPLSNLDAALRATLRAELAILLRRLEATAIYVTHDQVEAMTVGHRIAVMRAGRVEQVGTPREVYARPATLFVAGFLGSPAINVLPLGEGPAILGAKIDAPAGATKATLRPEAMRVIESEADRSGLVAWSAKVKLVEPLGGETITHAEIDGEVVRLKESGFAAREVGEAIVIGAEPSALSYYDGSGKRVATEGGA
jgi:multiple sugar transport system ATP-binding protein